LTNIRLSTEQQPGLSNTAVRPSTSGSYQTANPQQLQAAGIQPLVKGPPHPPRFNSQQVM